MVVSHLQNTRRYWCLQKSDTATLSSNPLCTLGFHCDPSATPKYKRCEMHAVHSSTMQYHHPSRNHHSIRETSVDEALVLTVDCIVQSRSDGLQCLYEDIIFAVKDTIMHLDCAACL